ncbi:tail fiber domain-containing protein [Bartonella bacilliformis]|uniref:Peptidase S74 domain-containing protein n=1 Tax=Bartonella bacilliformis Ver097 TaxID=1293911 RepID=A0A072R3W2_BARBA|nr:tail fiber domain-containing protein [Bartonella bacilliformis]KEG20331.1 hypothetical protein H710_00406 [Bartonella bacilliformis Ver097]
MSRRETTPQAQTTTQTNAPPAWAIDIFKKAASDALNLYNKGMGEPTYQGERYAGLGETTQNAIKGLSEAAQKYSASPLNDWLKGPTNSATNLSDMAAGNLIGNNNKFQEALNNALSKTSDSINQSMAGAGRYGSGAHTGVLTNELGALATKANAQQYNQDVQNMINANKLIDGSMNDQVNAANNFYQGQSHAQSSALKGGVLQDADRQSALDAEREKWTEQENQAWNRLEKLLQAGVASAGNYGTKTGQSTTMPSVTKDPLSDAMRWLGLIKGIAGLSDVRMKDNIVPVGQKNGYPLYEFNYKGGAQRYRGVMAQDVLHLNPDAVHCDAKTHLLYVYYNKLGFNMETVDAKVSVDVFKEKQRMQPRKGTFLSLLLALLACLPGFRFWKKGDV